MKILKSSMMALTISLGMIAMPALAAVPTDASLKELMTVTKVDEMAKQMMAPDSAMNDQMVQAMLAGIPENEISASQRQQLGAIVLKYNKEMLNDQYVDSLNKQLISNYIKAAKKHFTQQEVDAQIAFYGSALGQSIIAKQPAMMQEYMSETMPIVMQGTMEQMQKVMPRMQAEIKALKIKVKD